MGKFPWKDVKKAVFFGLVIWFSTWVKTWCWIRALHTDHGWTEAQIGLLATVISAILGFLAFSVIFARPVLSVRWNTVGSHDEQPGPRLAVPADGKQTYVLTMRLSAESFAGDLAIRLIKKMDLRPTALLGSPDYVRMVADRGATTVQPDEKGISGIRGSWGGTLEKAVFRSASKVSFVVVTNNLVSSDPNKLKHTLQLEPLVARDASVVKRRGCEALAKFVHTDAKVTSIYVE